MMKTFMLTPDQIPMVWEPIKYAAVSADHVEEKYRPNYLNRLLYQLLSSKAQCFVRIDSNRSVQAVAITKIVTDEIRDEASLFVSCLYSFVKVSDEQWKSDIEILRSYALMNECKSITCWATSDKVAELIRMIGMKERFKSFIMEV